MKISQKIVQRVFSSNRHVTLVDRRVSIIQWAWWNSLWISCCLSLYHELVIHHCEQWSKPCLDVIIYIVDYTTKLYIHKGIIMSYFMDPYEPTNMMGCQNAAHFGRLPVWDMCSASNTSGPLLRQGSGYWLDSPCTMLEPEKKSNHNFPTSFNKQFHRVCVGEWRPTSVFVKLFRFTKIQRYLL